MRKVGTKQSRLDMCRWNQGPRSELRGKEQQCVLATGKKKGATAVYPGTSRRNLADILMFAP